MPDDPTWTSAPPEWIASVESGLDAHGKHGRPLSEGTRRLTLGFLRSLEVEHFPRAAVEVLAPTCCRITWCNGRRTVRMEFGAYGIGIFTSHPDPSRTARGLARGQLTDVGRRVAEWFRTGHFTPSLEEEP
jgi:hypothetical protein